MNTTPHTQPAKQPIVIIDPNRPSMEFIASQTWNTTPVVNREDIEEADIIEETADNSAILTLGEQAMRIIFESLRKKIYSERRDDNEYELEWGPYTIYARHHYEETVEYRHDYYFGESEAFGVVKRDEIEIVGAYNCITDIEDDAIVARLNEYNKLPTAVQPQKKCLHITNDIYNTIARKLRKQVLPNNTYWKGIIEHKANNIHYRFIGTMIIYPGTVKKADGDVPGIKDVVSVWCELHSYNAAGDEVLNDSTFDHLKKCIID